MKRPSKFQAALPQNWAAEFLDKADLEASFAALDGCKHFHADTMRGRIRSLQMRLEEAVKLFERAYAGACIAPRTVPNLMRELTLHAYWLENRLLEGPVESMDEEALVPFPEFPPRVVEEFPEVRVAERIRDSAEALVRLHTADYSGAAETYSRLVERDRSEPGDVLASHYIGLSAAVYNVGLRDGAIENLENAGLCLQVGGRTLNRVRFAATLQAIYGCIGEEQLSAEWRDFVARLDCPEATKEASARRSGVLVERWTQESRLLVF